MKRLLAALFVVFLHFSGQLASLGQIRNRYFRHWDFTDSAAIFAAILLLSLLSVAISLILDRPRFASARKIYHHLFLLALASGLLANVQSLRDTHPSILALMWLCIVWIIGFSLGYPKTKLVSATAKLCTIFSPIVPLVFFQTLSWESWSTPLHPLSGPKTAAKNATPVFLFVFDEWSYARSTEDGEFLPFFNNLRSLCRQSVVFRQAYSPADATYKSLPMFIYQSPAFEDLPATFVRTKDGGTVTRPKLPGETAAVARSSNLFRLAKDRGYNTLLLGFYLPYGKMLGDELDCCRAYPHYPRGDGLLAKMWLRSIENLRYLTDPVSCHCFRPVYARIYSQYWLSLNKSLHDGFFESVGAFPANTLTLLHFPLPHAPFIFNEDGSFRGAFPVDPSRAKDDDEDRMKGTPEDYGKHLKYLDVLLGEILGKLRAAGRFDDALIVLTSDHSWREEQDPRFQTGQNPRRRVPLIVKLPREIYSHVIDSEFHTIQLKQIIDQVLEGTADEKAIVSWAQRQ